MTTAGPAGILAAVTPLSDAELAEAAAKAKTPTAADVRLEVAKARARSPELMAQDLRRAARRIRQARAEVAEAARTFARTVDRGLAAHGEPWLFETLELDEAGIVALVRAETPALMDLDPRWPEPPASQAR